MRHVYLIGGITTLIGIALGLLFAEQQPVEPQPAIGNAVSYETIDGAYPAPLPPSAQGYPVPMEDPYPYPYPQPTDTRWELVKDCELWWVVCKDEPTPAPPLPTAAPTMTPPRIGN